ncbi:hypothetical protein [Delftia sp. RIT313]|uniref:hypothetical protein n=1 Tax=Delftia sp. RIT313 TaxID=1468410 RepID=UPI001F432FF8|nr:hypothetical protein [Delftia sp. RIT313]
MSQRECAGFNWPPLAIPAEEPVSIRPSAVSRAGWLASLKASFTEAGKPIDAFAPFGIWPVIETPCRKPCPPIPSDAFGVCQPARFAAWFNVMLGVVASIEGQRSASVLVGVGQPASRATSFSGRALWVRSFPASFAPFQSLA